MNAILGNLRDPSWWFTAAPVLMRNPPKVKVMPQVTAQASKGGVSRVLAQLVLSMASPWVRRPSLTLGLKRMSLARRGVVGAELFQRPLSGRHP